MLGGEQHKASLALKRSSCHEASEGVQLGYFGGPVTRKCLERSSWHEAWCDSYSRVADEYEYDVVCFDKSGLPWSFWV